MLKKGDIFLVGIIALIVVLSYWAIDWNKKISGDDHRMAVISKDNHILQTLDLDLIKDPKQIKLLEGTVVILAEKGKIRFQEANCADKTCVRTGWLTHNGDMAVCLPNRLMIKIKGEKNSVDGTTY